MGQAPAPQPGGTPFGLSQVHSPPGTATPATFGESLGDLPKRTNVGIFVGMGAGVLVTLIAAVVFFLVHAPASGTTNGAGHTETTAGASATAAPPPTGSTAADTPTPAETASSPPPPASAVPSLAPDPVPPATAGVDSPTPGSLADSPKPPGDHPNLPTGTQPTAAPQDNPHPSTGHNDPGTSSHSQQHSAPRPTGTATGGRRPKHEDLGI
jgi:hypothetical protein